MEGVLFYWLFWMAWVVVTFIFRKNQLRTLLSFGLLLCIALSNSYLSFSNIKVNAGFLILLLLSSVSLKCRSLTSTLYHVLAIMTISLSYVLLHIYILFDPAILLIIHPWMLIIPILFVVHFLVRGVRMRIVTSILGVCLGECLLTLVFISFDQSFGDFASLDDIALISASTYALSVFTKWLNKLRMLYERQFPRRISK